MNLQLDQTYEIILESTDTDATKEELIGEIFIRCNNVLFIREYKEIEQQNQQTDSKPIENDDNNNNNGNIHEEENVEDEKVTINEDIEIDKE